MPTKMTMSNETKTNVLDELPFYYYDDDAIDSFRNLPPRHDDDADADDDVVSDVDCRRSCLGRLANHRYHASWMCWVYVGLSEGLGWSVCAVVDQTELLTVGSPSVTSLLWCCDMDQCGDAMTTSCCAECGVAGGVSLKA